MLRLAVGDGTFIAHQLAEHKMKIMLVLLLSLVLVVDAWAGPIHSMEFVFADDGVDTYRCVSGDLPFEATAQLSGQLFLSYDIVTGDAQISYVEGTLHSPKNTVGNFSEGAAWLEGADLEVEVPGIFDGMAGVRTGPSEFTFGPSDTINGRFRTEYVLSIDSSELHFSGKAESNRMDGPSIFLNALLVRSTRANIVRRRRGRYLIDAAPGSTTSALCGWGAGPVEWRRLW